MSKSLFIGRWQPFHDGHKTLISTVLGEGVKVDNLVQLAHNVQIGENCVIASQTGISGSVVIEDNVVIAGQVGIGDHARIEKGAVLGGQCGILPHKIVRAGQTVWGTPARPLKEYLKQQAFAARLPRLLEQTDSRRRNAPGGSRPKQKKKTAKTPPKSRRTSRKA